MRKLMKKGAALLILAVALLFSLFEISPDDTAPVTALDLDSIPAFTDQPYVVVGDNTPDFAPEDMTTDAFERYSPLDSLGRCGVAYANICRELMPTEPRGEIGHIRPSGWHSVKYDFVDGRYLFNRCHLIGFQLAGENDNEQNLITGTRYCNVMGMLPFENLVADYVDETDNHVLYRVTPIYREEELVARGVLMEAWSVEDQGEGVCFQVYVYNNQPGVEIDYATGESRLAPTDDADGPVMDYVLNTGSKKFHTPDCPGAASMKKENRQEFTGTRDQLLLQGYVPCGSCNP